MKIVWKFKIMLQSANLIFIGGALEKIFVVINRKGQLNTGDYPPDP